MAQPIGVDFIPSEDNQEYGAQRGYMEGDLAQAFKILSLRLPREVGLQGIAPNRLLQSPGAQGLQGVGGGFNPYAALFEAMIKASLGQPAPGGMPTAGAMPGAMPMGASAGPPPPLPPPRVTPGDGSDRPTITPVPGTPTGSRALDRTTSSQPPQGPLITRRRPGEWGSY